MRIGSHAGALVLATVAVAGCGGGGNRGSGGNAGSGSTGGSGGTGGGRSHQAQVSPATPETVPAPVITTPHPTTLTERSDTPILCTVYESGFATQVIFASESYDVRAECRAWTRGRPSEGFLWGYQPARVATTPTESRQVCYLTDRAGIVAARVIEVTGLREISAAEAAHASSACMSLTAAGWIKAHPVARAATRR